MVKMIFACDKHTRAIGRGDELPWHLTDDLKFFKQVTANSILLCGRKTYQSLPKLSGRTIYVATKNKDFKANDKNEIAGVVTDIPSFIRAAKNFPCDVYIIGGATIYSACEPYVDELIITELTPPNGYMYYGDAKIFDYRLNFQKTDCLNIKTNIDDNPKSPCYGYRIYIETYSWKRRVYNKRNRGD
ncbi:MAG: dihydrofolate reductase [Clostridia bacterium]|nr:dihydrofolate reductase [Clostridia bacterium]